LKQRIVTGIIGGVLFLALVFMGNIGYSSLVLLLAIVGLYEFLRMARIGRFLLPVAASYGLMLSIIWPQLMWGGSQGLPLSSILMPVTVLLLVYSVYRKNTFHIEHVALTILGALYIGYGFMYMAMARNIPENGLMLTILALLGIWSTDSGAYFVGKAIGKRKLWPEISPNKTLEGSVGGLITALVVVALTNLLFGGFSFAQAMGIALIAGIAGQIGDLIESAIKRHFGVKDSGTLLPGHGGVLDRFDSLIVVFPMLYLFGYFQ